MYTGCVGWHIAQDDIHASGDALHRRFHRNRVTTLTNNVPRRSLMGRMLYKICLLGDFAVGKTSLVRRFVFDEFQADYKATIGVHVSQKQVSLPGPSTRHITFIIWDLVGGEPQSPVTVAYYRGSAGALLVADISRPQTIERLGLYLAAFRQVSPQAHAVVLLNKVDLLDTPDEAQTYAQYLKEQYGLPIFLTSARTGMNVERAFLALGEQLHAMSALTEP